MSRVDSGAGFQPANQSNQQPGKAAPLFFVIAVLCIASTACVGMAANGDDNPIAWRDCLKQKPLWYRGPEAIRIADNVLLYQRNSGGWPKNIDMATMLSDKQKTDLRGAKKRNDAMLDNGATHTQLRYLATVYTATKLERFKTSFLKGMDYVLAAQYPNGGWPQRYPIPGGYGRYITFNDGAMTGALIVLRNVAEKKPGYTFVGKERRKKAQAAVEKGIDCILKCQIVVNGKRTAWCAQHDEKSLKPRPARSYEKISISGCESVGVVEFLMGINKPSPEIIDAIQSAVAWFDRVKITGIRQTIKPDPSLPRGRDKIIVKDTKAPPLWARFYQIGTNKPIFCGRDGKIKETLAEIEPERRTGYSWYGFYPAKLLAKSYPAWQKKWAPGKNVLDRK